MNKTHNSELVQQSIYSKAVYKTVEKNCKKKWSSLIFSEVKDKVKHK